MNTDRFRAKMVKEAAKDIEARQRRIEILKAVDSRIVNAAARTFESPAAAADWLMTATVSIGDLTPLDMATNHSGRSAVLRILARIEKGT